MSSFNQLLAQDKQPLQDHCGIVALYSPVDSPLFIMGVSGLLRLQTRGYDGAGFVGMTQKNRTYKYKSIGKISEVFDTKTVSKYKNRKASTWLFQTRYGTNGNSGFGNVQPVIMSHTSGEKFALVHNGQFSSEKNTQPGHSSDTIKFARQLAKSPQATWDQRILHLHNVKRGAWSLAISTPGSLYLLRDNFGVRPLSMGIIKSFGKTHSIWAAASETAALESMGIQQFWEVLPGSVIKISDNKMVTLKRPAYKSIKAACSFENIYVKDGLSRQHEPRAKKNQIKHSPYVETFRKRSGSILAREAPVNNSVDVAVGVPGTGITGGRSYASTLGIPYIQIINDRSPQEDERTFMTPNIKDIPRKVLEHFHFADNFLKDMNVVMVDDSVVRGNITKNIIKLLKTSPSQGGYGAKSVHVRILCPPIVRGCYLGINTRKKDELIAAKYIDYDQERNPIAVKIMIEKICQEINADSLAFLSAQGLMEATGQTKGLCMGCMLGHFPPIDRLGKVIKYKN